MLGAICSGSVNIPLCKKALPIKTQLLLTIWKSITLQLFSTQSSIGFSTEPRQMMILNIFAGIVVTWFVHYSMKARTCRTQLLHWFWDKLTVQCDTNRWFKSLSNYTPVSKQPTHTWLLISWSLFGAYLIPKLMHHIHHKSIRVGCNTSLVPVNIYLLHISCITHLKL